MKTTGGLFLLHEPQTVRLVGSLVSGLSESGHGLVLLSWFADAEVLTISVTETAWAMTMSREIAMALISLLQVLLAQISHLSEMMGTASDAVTSPPIQVTVERKRISSAWASNPCAKLEETDGQLVLRMTEEFAAEFVRSLVTAIGRYAAGSLLNKLDDV